MSKKTSIGGQALIEGIMMKGPYKTSMAVRKKDGDIDIVEVKEKHLKDKYKIFGWPLIRGMVNLIESMVIGYKTMMQSAEISGFADLEEETEVTTETAEVVENTELSEISAEELVEEPKEGAKEEPKKESVLVGAVMVVGSVLGVLLAVALFMWLPSLAFKGI